MTAIEVTLTRTWLTLMSDPTQSVTAWTADRQGTDTLGGDFRPTAGGGRIVVTTDDDDLQVPVTLQNITADDYAKVRAWRGKTVLLRDFAGQRVIGSYLVAQHTEMWADDTVFYTVQLTLTRLPVDEGV